ncbi:MAG: altronate dehydratase family protein [Negativicutes bacterium]|nr:altronate dehydratase family protein [Negativicutes bacterium]
MALFKIHAADNVAVALEEIRAGSCVQAGDKFVSALNDIPQGHKIALAAIAAGENIIKYGFPIGAATVPIQAGEHVHTHNVRTNLGEILDYTYEPALKVLPPLPPKVFRGYRRPDGRVGTRNEVWIIPTVVCVNHNAALIARRANAMLGGGAVEGVYAVSHPYGCSQMGEDHATTQRILANLVNHPNAGAVLVLGLGCENNHIAEFKKVLGSWDDNRVKFLEAQSVADEIEAGVELVGELIAYASQFRREECLASDLIVGLKCGGSDAFSGITANPLVGSFSDRLIAMGGSTVLTEVPEMFGAETILMNRAESREVFAKTVKLINDFKKYYQEHNQPIYENPSPGNKQGGITTLEDKSLGCTQKGGAGNVVDVLPYGGVVAKKGLTLLSGPGNDAVAVTALAAAGCQVILFTTGRGTPLGTVVPTIKVATNSEIFARKANWLDYNAGRLLAGETMDALADDFTDHVLAVASGQLTKSERMGFREIAIFKNGVTL